VQAAARQVSWSAVLCSCLRFACGVCLPEAVSTAATGQLPLMLPCLRCLRPCSWLAEHEHKAASAEQLWAAEPGAAVIGRWPV
jgi:hypothetical protein